MTRLDLKSLRRLVAGGEALTVEFKDERGHGVSYRSGAG
jgi:hypothetical protein